MRRSLIRDATTQHNTQKAIQSTTALTPKGGTGDGLHSQVLHRRTQAIQFKRSVARELEKAGIAYQQDYCQGPYSTDFLIEKDGQRIALECRVDVGREVDEPELLLALLKERLDCVEVQVVVPYVGSPSEGAVSIVEVISEIHIKWNSQD